MRNLGLTADSGSSIQAADIDTISTMRVLVAIASYGERNDEYLRRLIAEYRSMSFPVHIIVLSDRQKDVGPEIELVVGLPTSDPCSLPFAHRNLFAKRLNDYDVFIYSEDDTLITEKNIESFVQLSDVMPDDELPGFLRFEHDDSGNIGYPEFHGHYHWDTASVRKRGEYTLACFTNLHSACYALTREQLKRAIESGGFLVKPHQEKYDLCCSAATDPYTQCGFQKLMCISHLGNFLVHHLSNKYVGTLGIGQAECLRQVETLLQIGNNSHRPIALFETQSKLRNGRYSKSYYESARPEVMSAIPVGARSVLSIGCGAGVIEKALAKRGMRVVAVPLDTVIAGAAADGGLEIVEGDFASVRHKLAKERFDCVLLPNILHLIKNPVGILASFSELLSPNGVVIALTPNLRRIPTIWHRLCRDPRYRDVGLSEKGYRKSGLTFTSRRTIQSWVRNAGLRVRSMSNIVPSGSRAAAGAALGLMDAYFATEFLVVAEKSGAIHQTSKSD